MDSVNAMSARGVRIDMEFARIEDRRGSAGIDRPRLGDAMDRLDAGVARGIIPAEQRDALRALDVGGSPAPIEAHRGLNAVTVAYWVGGIAVLGAFGWFLVRRW